ncbi:ABC transporter substrate-binding protein [Paenibacillus sp. JCM 10914]|uniref:ABC transporter substrate-binding protein n=1 Tax=Paenibacillus sp. JCM 10914 TaxID=1236974 RepID=UPI0003CC7893|nr:extracellular solute-binding protein [Paenibacillus sp. JCM 10914]GAE07562.1 extracellular solute-binding protein, family 1 [Paenibacillus sp. JCM 10914]
MKSMRLWMLTVIMALVLAGCGGSGGTTSSDNGTTPQPTSPDTNQDSKTADPVTLKMFTAYADRANGPGKIEQEIVDAYMQDNPNVKIEVEALQDEPYKAKIKVYASTNQLPDIIQAWGQPSFLSPLLDNDMLLELNPDDFSGSEFVPGSVDGFSKDGKQYGLPRNTDYAVLYYNQKIFDDNGLKVPTTVTELLDVVKQLRAKNINCSD